MTGAGHQQQFLLAISCVAMPPGVMAQGTKLSAWPWAKKTGSRFRAMA
ncbi:MAG: hypothetical protein ACLSHU_04850 [Oscillospiraceae bacterium]